MAEQPPWQIGKQAIQHQLDDGAFAAAHQVTDNHSDGDFDQSQTPRITSESVDSHTEQSPIPELEEDLKDLSLLSKKTTETDADLFDKFFMLLKNFDYNPQDELFSPNTELTYKYTRVKGVCDVNGEDQDQYRILIYIREELLNKPTELALATINMISSAFEKDATIIIFSRTSEYPDIKIHWLLKEEWPKRIKKGEFVPRKYIEYLTKKYNQIEQIQNPKHDTMMNALKKDVARILDGMLGKIQSD
jgi:hypothetical protein